MNPASLIKPVHFDDFSGVEFERLVFAYMLRTQRWCTLEWYGQVGADLGRDIWGERDDYGHSQVCIQCANRKRLTLSKVKDDVGKAVSGPHGLPNEFMVISGCNISARFRDEIKAFVAKKGIPVCHVLSSQEFEERLRAEAESLLRRFVQGEVFPDSASEICTFVSQLEPATDDEILALMAGLFDRPAFYTPFCQESSIPAFKKAITDTIEALNTGVHRLRDGTEIRRIPSRHQVKNPEIRRTLSEIEKKLSLLRAKYDQYLKDGGIKPCGCQDPECPVFFIASQAALEMDSFRHWILDAFRRVYPAFSVTLPPSHWSGQLGRKAIGLGPVVFEGYIPYRRE